MAEPERMPMWALFSSQSADGRSVDCCSRIGYTPCCVAAQLRHCIGRAVCRRGAIAWCLVCCLLLSVGAASLHALEWSVDLELGTAWFSRNVANLPGRSGDEVDLRALTGRGPSLQVRAHGMVDWPRHRLRLTAAPFRVNGSGELDSPTRFGDTTFVAGTSTTADYRFDTYRLSYRYSAVDNERWQLGIGLALLLRDAEIRLRQSGLDERTSNVGLVPLLHVSGVYRFDRRWHLLAEVEGAGAAQGRAIDATLQLRYAPRVTGPELGLGLRSLEGGADNSEVRAFAWYHSAVVVLGWRW